MSCSYCGKSVADRVIRDDVEYLIVPGCCRECERIVGAEFEMERTES